MAAIVIYDIEALMHDDGPRDDWGWLKIWGRPILRNLLHWVDQGQQYSYCGLAWAPNLTSPDAGENLRACARCTGQLQKARRFDVPTIRPPEEEAA